MRIEVLIDVKTILGEGPLWDVDEQRLYFIDSFGCNVFRCTARRAAKCAPGTCRPKIGSMALRKQGGAVLSLATRLPFSRFQDRRDAAHRRSRTRQAQQPHQRRQGRQARPLRRRLDGHDGGRARTARSTASIPISRCTSSTTASSSPTARAGARTARTFYFADTWTGEIWAYDYDLDTGGVVQPAHLRKVDTSRGGAADGSTVDAEGCLWNALVYDGRLVRYAPGRQASIASSRCR